MVKIQETPSSEYEKLDRIIQDLCERHGLHLEVTGWARKTYDIHWINKKTHRTELIARVESFVTVSGEILVFDDRGIEFAQDLGSAVESKFNVAEAVIIRARKPE